jgi:hypothetical protein
MTSRTHMRRPQAPLSPRALRRRAIFLPAVIVLTVWSLNVVALRTRIGPQQAAIWMFVFVTASVGLVWWLWWKAKESGVPPWRTALVAVAATFGWFMLSGALPELGRQPKIAIGDRGTRPGGGFTLSISNAFQRPELESLHARAQEFGPSGALAEFACGDSVPDFLFEITLEPAGEYNERLVEVGYTPRIDAGGAERCLSFGLSYLFDTALAEIDHGPPVDYGYVNPMTGQKLEPYVRGPLRKPICRCDLRHSGREWVAWSQQRAEELK